MHEMLELFDRETLAGFIHSWTLIKVIVASLDLPDESCSMTQEYLQRRIERRLNSNNWARLHQLTIIYLYTFESVYQLPPSQALPLTLPFLDLVLFVLLGLVTFLTASHLPVFFFNPLLAFIYSGSRSSSESTSACPIRLDQGALSGLVGSGDGARSSVE